jgi:pyruvate dehydrogenase E2 component (dihydrolipoamide acetyltransferase)
MAELTVRMPALSATMEDAELLAWLVEPGDEVRSGQPLAEVSTDKVDMELESPYDGVVAELLVEAGQRVDLGAPVATLTSEEEDLLGDLDLDSSGAGAATDTAADTDEASDASPEPAEEAAGSSDGAAAASERPRSIPLAPPPVRKRAKQLGVDLHDVPATGNRGHVTHADLTAHVEQPGRSQDHPPADAARPAAEPSPSSPQPARSAPADRPRGERDRRRAIRRATARTTTRSAAIPQFTLYRAVDLTRARERREGRSWTTEIARALAAALWRNPVCNATWDDDAEETVPLDTVRIGIAVATDDGLVTVGVDDPDAVDPAQADRNLREAIDRARAGRLTPDDMTGISSTISNLGTLGIDRFNALLVPPQATILSVGRMTEAVVVNDGRIRTQPQITLGLTVDHRVADGADGANLLETIAQRLEG